MDWGDSQNATPQLVASCHPSLCVVLPYFFSHPEGAADDLTIGMLFLKVHLMERLVFSRSLHRN